MRIPITQPLPPAVSPHQQLMIGTVAPNQVPGRVALIDFPIFNIQLKKGRLRERDNARVSVGHD